MGNRVKLPGRVESAEMGGIVTGAGEILDDLKGKTQEVINAETDAELVRLDETKQGNLSFDQTPTENSTNPVTSGGVYAADQLLSQAIEAILLLIPSAASALNKLVDLATMNSSISTATASFKGTYNLVSDLHLTVSATHAQISAALDALSLGADNNDYAFVQVPNTDLAPTDIKKTERYKFNGTNWAYEYDLNNSGFTAAQWAAINSNITAVLVSKLSALPTNEALTALLAAKQDNLTFDDAPTSGSNNPVKSGGIYTRNNEIIAMITALDAAKQDVLTFDITPTENSTNPVTSNGVYQAIYLVQAALAALDGRMLSAEHSIELLTEDVGVLRTLYQALSQSDIIVGALPASGVANTVYRVPGTSTYADWMYYDGAWVKLAEYTTLDGYLYKGIATPSSSPASSAVKMCYFALTAGTYTNFGNLVVTEGISILKYDGANWTQDKISYMDGGVFDVTAYSGREFTSLSALLSDANLNNLIPTAVRKGGMSIKFVESSDNKYVQFRYMGTSLNNVNFLNVNNWQGTDVTPTVKSKYLVESGGVKNVTDSIAMELYQNIPTYPFVGYMGTDFNIVENASFNSLQTAKIKTKAGEVFQYVGSSNSVSPGAFFFNGDTLVSSQFGGNMTITIDNGVDGVVFCAMNSGVVSLVVNRITPKTIEKMVVELESIVYDTESIPQVDSTKLAQSGSIFVKASEIKLSIGTAVDTREFVGYINADLSVTENSSFHSLITSKIPVQKGEVYTYAGRSAASIPAIFFMNNDTIVSTDYGNKDYTIPNGVNYIIAASFNDTNVPVILKLTKKGNIQEQINEIGENIESINTEIESINTEIEGINSNLERKYQLQRAISEETSVTPIINMEGGLYNWIFKQIDFSDNAEYRYSKFDVEGLNTIKVKGRAYAVSGGYALVTFVDSNNNVISHLEDAVNEATVSVPSNAKYAYVNGIVYATSTVKNVTYEYSSLIPEIDDLKERAAMNIPAIVCYGDSVTEGMAMDGAGTAQYGKAPWPAQLHTMMIDNGYEENVINRGDSGETDSTMIGRAGGAAMIIENSIALPNDTSAVELTSAASPNVKILLKETQGNVLFLYLRGDETIMFADGNYYAISTNAATQKNFIQKLSAENLATSIPANTLLIPNVVKFPNINIIFGGYNGNSSTFAEWSEKMRKGLDASGGKGLIIGSTHNNLWASFSDLTGSTADEKYQSYRQKAFGEFGNGFLDLYDQFFAHALDYALAGGFFQDKTQQELDAMAAKLAQHIVPAEFSYDNAHEGNVHLNKEGYYVVAKLVYDRLVALKYITK